MAERLHPDERSASRIRGRLAAAVFAGGVAGALLRAGVSRAFPWHGHGWPWATFLVNLGGTLLLGYLAIRYG